VKEAKIMAKDKYCLGIYWIDRPQTLGEFVDAAIAFLRSLQPVHKLFSGPLFMLTPSMKVSEKLEADLSNLETLVMRHGWDRKVDRRLLTGVLPDGTMTREGTSKLGFRLPIRSFPKLIGPSDFSLRLSAGNSSPANLSNDMLINFPTGDRSEFEDPSFVKRLLEIGTNHFKPELGVVTSTGFCFASQVRAIHQSIGWMNYWADASVRRDMPASADCEPFGPGGMLHMLQPTPPSADESEALARAKAVRDSLLSGQWLEFHRLRQTAAATEFVASSALAIDHL
jgi:hypothetical protein